MLLYTMRNPDKIIGLLGISTAADYTQALWNGLDKDVKKEVRRKGVYHLEGSDGEEPLDISLELIQDGGKYTVLDMPGECLEHMQCISRY